MQKSVDNHVKRGQYVKIFIFLWSKSRKYLRFRKILTRNFLIEKVILDIT